MPRRSRSIAQSLALGLLLAGSAGAAQDVPVPDAHLQEVISLFHEISRIPRGSGNERAIGQWLQRWGKDKGFKVDSGAAGNVFFRIPPTPGCEKAPGIVLQCHMDMVCEKILGSSHDFTKDPITLIQDGDWLRADGTSLGADDGIGMALALSIAADPGAAHPPLEVIFTTSEETNTAGARAIEREDVSGSVLLNLDSEWDGVLIVGDWTGAGGDLTLDAKADVLPTDLPVYTLLVKGLKGGHSGVDIAKQRGNAIKVLGQALGAVLAQADARLISVEGGTVRNAIPRSAEALVALPRERAEALRPVLEALKASVLKACPGENPDFEILLQAGDPPHARKAFAPGQARNLVALLDEMPFGVLAMDPRFPGLPETSINLGPIRTRDGAVTLACMSRGANVPRLEALNRTLGELSARYRARYASDAPGQPWLADPDSDLVKRSRAAYLRLFGQPPRVTIAPGGLECGKISRKCPGLEAISIGPEIQNPHSPDERVLIPSIQRTRALILAILASYR